MLSDVIGPYERERIETWASDFSDSDACRRLPPKEQEWAGSIVTEFLVAACDHQGAVPEDLDESGVSHALLERMPVLGLPEEVRPTVPEIVRDALTWLEESGRLGEGAHLGRMAMAAAKGYRERLAPGGGERLKPFVKKASRLGPNDPCPCGSGRKFKKCCGRL